MDDFGSFHVVFGDQIHGDQINVSGPNSVGKIVFNDRGRSPRDDAPPGPTRTVLMLMSNPIDTGRLRLEEEYRGIDKAIVAAPFRDRIDLRLGAAPRYHDLQELLLRHRPTVVHFAGHSGVNGIALVGDDGLASQVPAPALERLFGILGGSIRCVVLNACLTAAQATAIAAHGPCVVGTTRAVLDDVAIEFAAGFHRAIAYGQSVDAAFRLGCNAVDGMRMDSRDLVLVASPGKDAKNVFITS